MTNEGPNFLGAMTHEELRCVLIMARLNLQDFIADIEADANTAPELYQNMMSNGVDPEKVLNKCLVMLGALEQLDEQEREKHQEHVQ